MGRKKLQVLERFVFLVSYAHIRCNINIKHNQKDHSRGMEVGAMRMRIHIFMRETGTLKRAFVFFP